MTTSAPQAPSATQAKPLTPAMRRELLCIAKHGRPADLDDYSLGPLAWHARERVLTALITRGLIADAETVTDAGRAALAAATGAQQ